MKISYALALFTASALILSGCSSSAQAVSQPTPPQTAAPSFSVAPAQTASPTPSPSASLVINSHGNAVKKVGELAGAGGTTFANDSLKFKVTSIEPISCDAPYSTRPAGTALAVAIEVETTPNFKGGVTMNSESGLTSFMAAYWKGYASNGTRMNKVDTPAVQSCVADQSRLLPDTIGRGEKVAGIVILEVTTPTGTIAYDGAGMTSGGWEWDYPAK
ncbi:hypothetical protein ACSBOX_05845 [Arthrobacter sp. KN11-1C]|uniref:hypothetical protein n=1 Tax=Arthrobacter sp. KN11-1C TaxID=3445774 RepID=UPI003FA0BD94